MQTCPGTKFAACQLCTAGLLGQQLMARGTTQNMRVVQGCGLHIDPMTDAHASCELCIHVEPHIQDSTCRSEETGPEMMQEGIGGQPGPPSLPHHLPGQQHPSNSESQAGQGDVPHPQAQPI